MGHTVHWGLKGLEVQKVLASLVHLEDLGYLGFHLWRSRVLREYLEGKHIFFKNNFQDIEHSKGLLGDEKNISREPVLISLTEQYGFY